MRRTVEPALALGALAWAIYVALRFDQRVSMFHEWPRVVFAAVVDCATGSHAHWAANAIISLGALASFAGLAAWVLALGEPIARRWFDRYEGLDRWLVRFASGAFLGHLVLFTLGVAGLWSIWVLRTVIAVPVAIATASWLRRRSSAEPRAAASWPTVTAAHVVRGVVLVWIAWAVLEGLAPETGADAGIYHVGVANTWLLDGGIHFIADHYASNLPLPQSVFYGALLALGPAEATGAMQPALLFVAALVLRRIVKEEIGGSVSPFAIGCVLAVPALNGYLAISGNDQFTIVFFSLGTWLALRSVRSSAPDLHALALSGACLGLAMSAKYTAWIFVGIAALSFATEWWLRHRALRPLLGGAAMLCIPPGVWAAKAAVLTGNPVFPAMRGIFGTRFTAPPGIERAIDSNVSKIETLSDLASWPFDSTFDTPALMHNPGPHWLALAPLAIVVASLVVSDRGRALRVFAFLVAGWLGWAYGFTNARYAGPLFVASALALSVVAHRALRVHARAPRLWGLATFVVLAWSTGMGWGYRISLVRPHTYHCGAYDPIGYVTQPGLGMTVAPPDPLYAWLGANLNPATDRVLVIGESRTHELAIPYVSGDEYDAPVFRRYVATASTADEVRRHLAADGITHIALNLAAGRMYEGYSFRILTLEPDLERRWTAFFVKTELLVHHIEERQDWAVTEILDAGVQPAHPAPDLVGAARRR